MPTELTNMKWSHVIVEQRWNGRFPSRMIGHFWSAGCGWCFMASTDYLGRFQKHFSEQIFSEGSIVVPYTVSFQSNWIGIACRKKGVSICLLELGRLLRKSKLRIWSLNELLAGKTIPKSNEGSSKELLKKLSIRKRVETVQPRKNSIL